MDFVLSYNGLEWHCENDIFSASGADQGELLTNLQQEIRDSGKYDKGTEIKIKMMFDFDAFPTWLRQYQSHYFNSITILKI